MNNSYTFAIFGIDNILICHKMNDLGKRIQHLRKGFNLSQTGLADKVGISYAQIGRYETKGAQPPAEILKRLSDILDTTVDFLINGNLEEKARATLKDSEVLRQFKAVDTLPDNDKNALLRVISGFIRDCRTKQAYAS